MPNCVESFSLKAAGIFVKLLSQDVFKNYCPETSHRLCREHSLNGSTSLFGRNIPYYVFD